MQHDYARRALAYTGRVLIGIAIILSLWRQAWGVALLSAIILVVTLVPYAVRKWTEIHVPAYSESIFVVFIFLTLFLGEMREYYDQLFWWDSLTHFMGGVTLGFLGIVILYGLSRSKNVPVYLSPLAVSIGALWFAVTLGVFWEFFEFGMDHFIGTQLQAGLWDTNMDLILDTVGALAMCVGGYLNMRRHGTLPVFEDMDEFAAESRFTFASD